MNEKTKDYYELVRLREEAIVAYLMKYPTLFL
jgi:hypothetical protein